MCPVAGPGDLLKQILNMRDPKKRLYHFDKKNKAQTGATLRGLVSLYVCYLGYRSTPLYGEPDGISIPLAWVLGLGLIVAGVIVLVYTVVRYRHEVTAAEYTDEEYAQYYSSKALSEDDKTVNTPEAKTLEIPESLKKAANPESDCSGLTIENGEAVPESENERAAIALENTQEAADASDQTTEAETLDDK